MQHLCYVDERTPTQIKRVHSQDVKRVMRRVSKENVKPIGRLLGKLLCMAPVTVSAIIMDQIKAYENMIIPIVDSLRFASPLALDTLVALLLQNISGSGRNRMKEDGVHVAGWLQRVAVFMAHLCKKYALFIDLDPVISTLTGRLDEGFGDELVCLTELFKVMGGVETTMSTINERVLEVSFGGPVLRGESVDTNNIGRDPVAVSKLLSALTKQPKCKLWRLLAKQPSQLVTRHEFDQDEVKAQSHAFDSAFDAFYMYSRFVEEAGEAGLVAEMPGVGEMLAEGIERHYAMLMIRVRDRLVDTTTDKVGFDRLSVQDVLVPTDRYEAEIARLKAIACSPQAQPKDKERALGLVLKLELELQESTSRLEMMKQQYVEPVPVERLIERAIMTPTEAVFCAHYLIRSGGSVRDVLSGTSNDDQGLSLLLTAFSEREAACFGRFMSIAMSHSDKTLTVRDHVHLFSIFNQSLLSTSFIAIRNAILVLTKLDGHFPVHRQIALALEQRCRQLHEGEEREDVRVLSTRCRALMAAVVGRLGVGEDVVGIEVEQTSGSVDHTVIDSLTSAFAEIESLASSSCSVSVTVTSDNSPAIPPNNLSLEEGEHPSPQPIPPRPSTLSQTPSTPKPPSPLGKRRIEDAIGEEDAMAGRSKRPGRERDGRDVRKDTRRADLERDMEREREREKDRERERERRHSSSRSYKRDYRGER
jgi:hypothetical protein